MGAAIACKDTAWTPRGSAETVLSEIRLGGAANVAKRIDADESFGRSVMNGVETGDSAWLQVAANITPASGAAEASLSIALASALPRSPERSWLESHTVGEQDRRPSGYRRSRRQRSG